MSHRDNEGHVLVGSAYALMRALIPDPDEEYAEIEAELRDDILCWDEQALVRTQREMDRRGEFYSLMTQMWRQAADATKPGDLSRLQETTTSIREALAEEWAERNGPVP